MAFVNMNLYSDVLNMDTDVSLLLPEKRHGADEYHPDKKYPVVYVLHGYGDNHTAWIRKSIIEMVARNLECVVVMPSCRNSFYSEGKNGFDYYHFLTEELPLKIGNWFPVSNKREDTFIMGNSMGGYGAFMIAMRNPDKYAAAVSFSGVMDLQMEDQILMDNDPKLRKQVLGAFGSKEEFNPSEYHLHNAAMNLDRYEGEKPRLFAICGTEDPICYDGNEKFNRFIKENTNLHIKYETSAGGHDFIFWNKYIDEAFEFFDLK